MTSKLLTSTKDITFGLHVRQQLMQWGMSSIGVQQIASGQMPTHPNDRLIVANIVAHAARAPNS